MSVELLAMLGGSMSGFIMKLIAAQAQNQAQMLEGMLKKQQMADESADRAAKRTGAGGVWIRRVIALCTLFAEFLHPSYLRSLTSLLLSKQEKQEVCLDSCSVTCSPKEMVGLSYKDTFYYQRFGRQCLLWLDFTSGHLR